MQRLGAWGATLVACALCALPAVAHADGLYEPFPDAASKARAERFVERLAAGSDRLRVTDQELERGVFLEGDLAAVERGTAGPRAVAPSDFGPSFGWSVVAGSLVVILAAGSTLRLRAAASR